MRKGGALNFSLVFPVSQGEIRARELPEKCLTQSFKNMPRLYAYHFNDPTNLGDQVSSPVDYFEPLAIGERIGWDSDPGDFVNVPVIAGGGGLLNPILSKQLEKAVLRKNAPFIIWGIGTNTHNATTASYPDYLSHADLVGLRDFGNPFDYVPCPSCMHPAFDRQFSIQHDFVIYEHSHHTIGIAPSAPRMGNDQPKENMEEVIRFLSSGETVITNTYHGCYWAMLLNRRVLVYRPFSSRFFYFNPEVTFCDSEDWRDKIKYTTPTPEYLQECRMLNLRFAQKVFDLLALV